MIRVPAAQTGAEGAYYYLLVTSNDAPDAFPILRSRTLADWELRGFVFPRGRKPSWAEDGLGVSDFWAAEMHDLGGQFLVCFAARQKDGSLAIGLARSSRPEGPFVSDDAPDLIRGRAHEPNHQEPAPKAGTPPSSASTTPATTSSYQVLVWVTHAADFLEGLGVIHSDRLFGGRHGRCCPAPIRL